MLATEFWSILSKTMARPRTQPEEVALEKALRVFWTNGYDRTSISDLTEALGVGPSSIYNAFGSKSGLFRMALEHYGNTHLAFVRSIVADATGRGAEASIRTLLERLIDIYANKKTPPGCAIFQGGGGGGPAGADGAEIAHAHRMAVRDFLVEILSAEMPGERLADSRGTLAWYLLATLGGLSQLACDGATRKELRAVAELTCRACFVHPESEARRSRRRR